MAKPWREVFKEFEGELNSFRETLAFAYFIYKIKKSRLSQLYFDDDESFDKVVGFFLGWLRVAAQTPINRLVHWRQR